MRHPLNMYIGLSKSVERYRTKRKDKTAQMMLALSVSCLSSQRQKTSTNPLTSGGEFFSSTADL